MSITKNNKIRCDYCGRFISYKDLRESKAHNIMIFPDSLVTEEEYESYHVSCQKKSAENVKRILKDIERFMTGKI